MSGIIFNQDCDAYQNSRAGERLDRQAVASWVDQYAQTQVKELFLNVNAMRAAFDSKVWDSYWSGYLPDAPDGQAWFKGVPQSWFDAIPREHLAPLRACVHTAWQLNHDGIDVYAVWTGRCRQVGISPWLSMRMNDVHYTGDRLHPFHSEFWRSRSDLWRVGYRATWWEDRALDYGKTEVREYVLRLVREIAQRYDFDGLELDWMRHLGHLRPGHERQDAACLTDLVREVRKILDERQRLAGHPIHLAVRVPSRPNVAYEHGLDVIDWARQGLVKTVTASPSWGTCEQDMPLEVWRQLLAGTDILLAAALEINLTPYPGFPSYPVNSLETVRGLASSYLDRGADRVYLFNYFDSDVHQARKTGALPTGPDLPPRERSLLCDDYATMLREIGNLDTLAGKPRRHVLTYATSAAPGEPVCAPLPALCKAPGWVSFLLYTGPRPAVGSATVLLGILDKPDIRPETLHVRLNGERCPFRSRAELGQPKPDFPVYVFETPVSAMLPRSNLIEVSSPDDITIGWVELAIRPA